MREGVRVGDRESSQVEFKSSDISLEKISRAVVAMLNGEGGTVWVGVEERSEVAVAFQALTDDAASARCRRIEDHLQDTIEPPPRSTDVQVQLHALDGGGNLIRLDVSSRPSTQVFAQRKGSARHYPVRAGARIRDMTYSELRDGFATAVSTMDDVRRDAATAMRDRWAGVVREGTPCMWIRVQPIDGLSLDLEDLRPTLRALVEEPVRTGNRPLGWVFCLPRSPYAPLSDVIAQHEVVLGPPARQTRFGRNGSIDFVSDLESFDREGQERLNPWALLEYPTSVLRLAALRLRDAGVASASEFLVNLGLLGIQSWSLAPGDPRRIAFRDPGESFHDQVLVERNFTAAEITGEPDRCAFRVLGEVYNAFGLETSDIPLWDEATNRFEFGD